MRKSSKSGTVSTAEIDHFSRFSAQWWDEEGPHGILHKMNKARLHFIRRELCVHFGREGSHLRPFKGLAALDIGCGGGLTAEPLARMGAAVTGVDADQTAIRSAKTHAAENGLDITYHCGGAEDLKAKFDIVLALEIIEHVPDQDEFVTICARLLRPGGMIVFSTLNRTPQSWVLGIGAAEYVLGWVPRGTHSWRQFVKPAELAALCRGAGLTPKTLCGAVYNPLTRNFILQPENLGINYFLAAVK